MRHSLKFIILLSAASLALSAPTENVEDMKVVQDKEIKRDMDEKISTAAVVDDKNSPKDVILIKEEKDKMEMTPSVDKKDETKANVESVPDVKKTVDEKKSEINSDVSVAKIPENKVENVHMTPSDIKTVLKKADEIIKKTDELVVEVNESIKNSEDPLKEVDSKLRDVASAVAEAVTNLPIPGKPDRPEGNKFSQVFGMFVNELMTVPMVILHAISNAISNLTGGSSKPQPASS